MKINYRSNNSGGSWWLKDDHWKALESAGWRVPWAKDQEDRMFMDEDGIRYMGALAVEAELECETPADAIRSFEKVTGMEASAEGCNCCGPPHSFNWTDAKGNYDFASGEGVLPLLYGSGPTTLREAYEQLKGPKP